MKKIVFSRKTNLKLSNIQVTIIYDTIFFISQVTFRLQKINIYNNECEHKYMMNEDMAVSKHVSSIIKKYRKARNKIYFSDKY